MKSYLFLLCSILLSSSSFASPDLKGLDPDQIFALPKGKTHTRNLAVVGTYKVNMVYRKNVILDPASGKPEKLVLVLIDTGRRPFPKEGDTITFTLADPAIISEVFYNYKCNPPDELHLISANAKYISPKPH